MTPKSILEKSVILVGFDEPGILIMPDNDAKLDDFSMDTILSEDKKSVTLNISYEECEVGTVKVFLNDDIISVFVYDAPEGVTLSEYEFLNPKTFDIYDYCNNVSLSNGEESFDLVNGEFENTYSI